MPRHLVTLMTATWLCLSLQAAAHGRLALPSGEQPLCETSAAAPSDGQTRLYFAAVAPSAAHPVGRLYRGYETAQSPAIAWHPIAQDRPVRELLLCALGNRLQLFALAPDGEVLERDSVGDRWRSSAGAPRASGLGCDPRGTWLAAVGSVDTYRVADGGWRLDARDLPQAAIAPTEKRLGSSIVFPAEMCARPEGWIDSELTLSGQLEGPDVKSLRVEAEKELDRPSLVAYQRCLARSISQSRTPGAPSGSFNTRIEPTLNFPSQVNITVGSGLGAVESVTLPHHLAEHARLRVESSVPSVLATVSGRGAHRRLLVSSLAAGGAFEGELVLTTNLPSAPRVRIPLRARLAADAAPTFDGLAWSRLLADATPLDHDQRSTHPGER